VDYVTRFSRDGTVLFVSDAVEPVLGYRPADLAGRSCLDFVHPEDRPAVAEALGEMQDEGSTRTLECRLLPLDGTERWFEVRAKSFWNDLTGQVEFISLARDVTRKKNILEALRNSEKAYRDIFDNAIVGIYRTVPEGRFLMANDAVARIMGYESGEELCRSVQDLKQQIYVNPDDRERTMNLLEGRESCVLEVPYRRKDGQTAWLSNHIRAVRDGSGRLLYYEGITYDVTERKRMEANLQQALDNLEQLVQERTVELNEANTALRVLLDRRIEDERLLEEKLQMNVNELLLPALDQLRGCGLSARGRHYVDLLEANLKDITSPFVTTLSSHFRYLTPREIEVASMIREGKKTKEIAELLGVSAITVDSHRISIRKKLGLTGDKANLRSRLLAIR
jgi:PAS domain S-box-containing protein